MDKPRIFVLGIDGGSWNLIDRFISNGSLPNFKKLKEKGAWGNLISSLPPVTYPAWKCYSTGKNPAKFGVFAWVGIDFGKNRMEVYDSRDFKSKEIWDYLGEAGYSCGVINMPSTFPPKKINGFMVGDILSHMNMVFTYPPGLKKELIRSGYKIRPDYEFTLGFFEKALPEFKKTIKSQFDLALKKMPSTDFMHLTIFHTDQAQHFLWNFMDDEKSPYKGYLEEVWKEMDLNLGRLLKKLPKDTYLIIMSDHGFCMQKNVFYINKWLENEGYLVSKKDPVSLLSRLGINKERILIAVNALGAKGIIKSILPKKILEFYRRVPTKQNNIGVMGATASINWEKSKVISVGEGPIYINKNVVRTKKEYNQIRSELIKKLEGIKSPLTNGKAIKKVYKKEDIYSGEFYEKAPDLLALWEEGCEIRGYITQQKSCWAYDNQWKAHHKREGIFAFYGGG